MRFAVSHRGLAKGLSSLGLSLRFGRPAEFRLEPDLQQHNVAAVTTQLDGQSPPQVTRLALSVQRPPQRIPSPTNLLPAQLDAF